MFGESSSTLRFVDRRRGGRFEVRDSTGCPVAFIRRPRLGQGSSAYAADGSALCHVRHWRSFSRRVQLFDHEGRPLGRLEPDGRQHAVVLSDGRRLCLARRWFGEGWVLRDDDGGELLSSLRNASRDRSLEELETGRLPASSPSINGHHFRVESFLTAGPDDWLVLPDSSLDLAHTVAIVEAYRMVVKTDRDRAGAS